MSKINQIQGAILSLDPGAYQKLMDNYIMRKYGFSNIMPLGSHSGTNKTTKGTPDSFVRCEDGRFILIAHGTVGTHSFSKVESDILACLDTSKTGIAEKDIAQIICCHTSTNFTPGQIKELCSHFENTTLIGLGDVSFDLTIKYPELALDHLGIDIDTHQIFTVDTFISYASQNPYYDLVPDEHISEKLCEAVLSCLSGAFDGEHCVISLETVLRIEQKQPGFFVKYLIELNRIHRVLAY